LFVIRLDNDFPRAPAMTGFYRPAALHNVEIVRRCILQHPAKINSRESAVDHPLQQMRAEFEIPIPPRAPVSLSQLASPQ
jgi:hypothetical protein